MINLDDITNENNKEHNEKWPYIPDHPYGILIIGGSGSSKTKASSHNLIMKINNRRNLRNIAIDDSADIDYKDFMKIYIECTKEPFNFLAIVVFFLTSE